MPTPFFLKKSYLLYGYDWIWISNMDMDRYPLYGYSLPTTSAYNRKAHFLPSTFLCAPVQNLGSEMVKTYWKQWTTSIPKEVSCFCFCLI